MDKFIYWPKAYLLLLTTCDEILSWIIEIWMKQHLVSDSKYIIIQKNYKEWQIMFGLTFSVSDTTPSFTISIGDTKYQI